jgi:hypothetical protein
VEPAKGITGLCSELSSCHIRCTPAVEEEDYDVKYAIDGVHWTFNIRTASNLLRSLQYFSLVPCKAGYRLEGEGGGPPNTMYRYLPDSCHTPELAGCVSILRWRWKLQTVCHTASLCSGLSSCYLRYTPVVDEEDYDVMYSIDGGHLTFKRRALSIFRLLTPLCGPPLPYCTRYCTSVQFTNFVRELLVNIASGPG